MSAVRAKEEDFGPILRLMEQNLRHNLDADEQRDGFLSTSWTEDMLREVVDDPGILVVPASPRDLAGFLLLAPVELYVRFPLTKVLLDRLRARQPELLERSVVFYGPACVAKEYRGRGVLEDLFQGMIRLLGSRYHSGITFVASDNARSLRAHEHKLGMRRIDEFEHGNRTYVTLRFALDIDTSRHAAFQITR